MTVCWFRNTTQEIYVRGSPVVYTLKPQYETTAFIVFPKPELHFLVSHALDNVTLFNFA